MTASGDNSSRDQLWKRRALGRRDFRRRAGEVVVGTVQHDGRYVYFRALGELPLHRSFSARLFPAALRERAHESLARVGLARLAHQRAGTLSGGQAQRVAVARALCQRARVILADEPVASLDPRAAESVLALLSDVAHTEQLGVLVVLHQPELACRYADRLVGMRQGLVVFDRPRAEVTSEAIDALYPADDDER